MALLDLASLAVRLHHPHGTSVGSGRLPMVRSRVSVGSAGADVQRDGPKPGATARDADVVQVMNVPLQEHIGHLEVNLQGPLGDLDGLCC